MSSGSLLLRLPRGALARRDVVRTLLGGGDARAVHAFAFKDAELSFARAVADKTHLWVYRVDQRAFGGDFFVVDVSSPDPAQRAVVALDLKRGARVREGRAGVQMGRADRALRDLVAAGVVAEGVEPTFLVGDAVLVLEELPSVLRRSRLTRAARSAIRARSSTRCRCCPFVLRRIRRGRPRRR